MSNTHHPSEAVLADFANGTLDEAGTLVVGTHLALCDTCRQTVRLYDRVGGVALEQIEPTAVSAAARQAVMARLDDVVAAPAPSDNPEGLPAPLARYELGPWRWVGRGVYWRSVGTAWDDDMRVFMLKAAPGTRLPHHRHQGREWTTVLKGAFRHELGRYGPGDFDEADETVEHRPSIEPGEECICVVALKGQIEMQGWLGRMIQPLVRL